MAGSTGRFSFRNRMPRLKRGRAVPRSSAALDRIANGPLLKALGAIGTIAIAIMVLIAIALILRFVSPKSQITVSAFQVFTTDPKSSGRSEKALSDMVVDDLHRILEEASQFHGNDYSSSRNFSSIPDMPHIPVGTSYGIEIKGISIDQLLATWSHLRYREFQVSGDLIETAGDHEELLIRYVEDRFLSQGRANSFEEPIAPDSGTIKKAASDLALKVMAEISPEAAVRYMLSQHFKCRSNCEEALDKLVSFCWDWEKRKPRNATAAFYLGYALADTHHPEDGLPALDWALKLNPKLYLALNNKAYILGEAGRYDEELRALQDSIRIHVTPNALLNVGIVYLRRGQYLEAEKYMRKALKEDPTFYGAYFDLGTALRDMGRNADAAEAYRNALQLRPDSVGALSGLTFVLAMDGKLEEARQECERAKHLDPDSAGPLIAEGRALLLAKRADEAGDQFRAALEKRNDAEAYMQWAIAYLAKGDLEDARSKLEWLQNNLAPNTDKYTVARIHHLLAIVLERQGSIDDSRIEDENSHRLCPWLQYDSMDDLTLRHVGILTTASAAAPGASKH